MRLHTLFSILTAESLYDNKSTTDHLWYQVLTPITPRHAFYRSSRHPKHPFPLTDPLRCFSAEAEPSHETLSLSPLTWSFKTAIVRKSETVHNVDAQVVSYRSPFVPLSQPYTNELRSPILDSQLVSSTSCRNSLRPTCKTAKMYLPIDSPVFDSLLTRQKL